MRRLFAAVTIAVAIALPARAQSFDPSIGSGNIGRQVEDDSAFGAHARVGPERSDLQGRTVLPYTLQEHRALERAKGSIW